MEALYLGIDIGTYSCKGVVTTADGRIVAKADRPHDLSIPRPGWAEHDADAVWWNGFVHLCRTLLDRPGVDAHRIRMVGHSAISPCLLCVDDEGKALAPGILYGIDSRAADQQRRMRDDFGDEALLNLSAVLPSAQSVTPKILWVREHWPEVWKRTRRLLSASGYITFKLTGAAVLDIYDAVGYPGLYDAYRQCWHAPAIDYFAPAEMLPDLIWSGVPAGRVNDQAARITGLPAGTPVLPGCADAASEALAAGLRDPGDMLLMYGSSGFLILLCEHLRSSRVFWPASFLEPGSTVLTGGAATVGSLITWFRDLMGQEEVQRERAGGPNAFENLVDLAGASPPGARGVTCLPYFSGERTPVNDPAAKGVFFGLGLGHGRADLYRAVLEAIAYAVRHNLDALAADGERPKRILAIGGGTHNHALLQIVSDVCGIEQRVPLDTTGAAYGDAMMAAVADGAYASLREASDWVRHAPPILPNDEHRPVYDAGYQLYRDLYTATRDLMRRASIQM